ncbi:DNA topoisomerase III [Vibrio scophthalmi]|uniref:DNA topoisomerase n=1 Tax=Vibrio scophthalmi LMG 19158 TaxID=870967 RepID=F9RQN7_9VIBR|nr:DNA topoisomerase III [Vibrio scophthalmi]EGU33968.1 DNA topoisomerase III [Vibrio scophthalmi LMG 19158]
MRLFIAEKPSLGRAIAETIGIKKSHKGYIECVNGDIVTWCIGHLLEQAEPEHYDEALKSWSFDTLPIIPKEWGYVAKEETQDQLEIVLEWIGKSDVIVNAGDPDREGAYLVNEILEFAKIPQKKWDNALRVLINDLNPKAVEIALEGIEPNSQHMAMSDAAKCRSRADWLIGMNISRVCTLLGKRQGHPSVFSFGRVQTPTCQLVVKRDLEIANFKSVPFFDIDAHFEHDGIPFKAKWQVTEQFGGEDKRCIDKEQAQTVVNLVSNEQAIVTTCETKRAKSQPPLPFSLKTLQEAMSSQYGYGAKQTLDIVQRLYEKHKIVSYPRTDQQYLTTLKRDEIELILGNLEGVNNKELAQWATDADTSLVSPCWNDKKLEGKAHTAIIPTTRAPDLDALDDEELNLFHAIASRYLAQFFPVAEDDKTVIELRVGEHDFKTTGTVEIEKGWRVVLGKNKESDKDDQSLPVLGEGQEIAVSKAELLEKKTTPPKPYTEGTLLNAMCNIAKEVTDPALKAKLKETAGLGTEATRAGMIETLKERGYLETKGKNIVSTPLGQMLILGLPNKLRDPAMTAIWEQQLDVVESGECSLEKFMAVIEKTVTGYVDDFKSEKLVFKLPQSTLPKCPKKDCAGFALEYEGKKGKAFKCSVCETRYQYDKGKVGKEIKKIKKLGEAK